MPHLLRVTIATIVAVAMVGITLMAIVRLIRYGDGGGDRSSVAAGPVATSPPTPDPSRSDGGDVVADAGHEPSQALGAACGPSDGESSTLSVSLLDAPSDIAPDDDVTVAVDLTDAVGGRRRQVVALGQADAQGERRSNFEPPAGTAASSCVVAAVQAGSRVLYTGW